MPKSEPASGLRRRKADRPAQAQPKNSKDQEPPVDKPPTDCTSLLGLCHQYGGGILGAASCVGTVATYQQHDALLAARLLAWMALGFLALLIHETRPFKRG